MTIKLFFAFIVCLGVIYIALAVALYMECGNQLRLIEKTIKNNRNREIDDENTD